MKKTKWKTHKTYVYDKGCKLPKRTFVKAVKIKGVVDDCLKRKEK